AASRGRAANADADRGSRFTQDRSDARSGARDRCGTDPKSHADADATTGRRAQAGRASPAARGRGEAQTGRAQAQAQPADPQARAEVGPERAVPQEIAMLVRLTRLVL